MVFHTLTRLASILILTLSVALPARAVTVLRDADLEYALAGQYSANNVLLQVGYGRALSAPGNSQGALNAFERPQSIDFRDGSMLRDLSVAYASKEKHGAALPITAKRDALRGRLEAAGIHANRAMGLLPEGCGPWQRAQDVFIASQRAAMKNRR